MTNPFSDTQLRESAPAQEAGATICLARETTRLPSDWKLPFNLGVPLDVLEQKVRSYESAQKFPKAWVLSGTSSVGKTSVLKELVRRGYLAVHEAATEVIESDERQGVTYQNVTMQHRLMRTDLLKVMNESHMDPDRFTLLDRGGLLESRFYFEYLKGRYSLTVPGYLRDSSKWHKKYGLILFFEKLPHYTESSIRIPGEAAQAQAIEAGLIEAYRTSGHEVVTVPAFSSERDGCKRLLSVAERADFIVDIILERGAQ